MGRRQPRRSVRRRSGADAGEGRGRAGDRRGGQGLQGVGRQGANVEGRRLVGELHGEPLRLAPPRAGANVEPHWCRRLDLQGLFHAAAARKPGAAGEPKGRSHPRWHAEGELLRLPELLGRQADGAPSRPRLARPLGRAGRGEGDPGLFQLPPGGTLRQRHVCRHEEPRRRDLSRRRPAVARAACRGPTCRSRSGPRGGGRTTHRRNRLRLPHGQVGEGRQTDARRGVARRCGGVDRGPRVRQGRTPVRRRGQRGAIRPRRRGHARRQPRHTRRVARGAAGQRAGPHPRQAHRPQGGGRGHIAGAALGVRDTRRRTGGGEGRDDRDSGVPNRLFPAAGDGRHRCGRSRPRADPQGGRRRPRVATAHDHGPPCPACRGLAERLLLQR